MHKRANYWMGLNELSTYGQVVQATQNAANSTSTSCTDIQQQYEAAMETIRQSEIGNCDDGSPHSTKQRCLFDSPPAANDPMLGFHKYVGDFDGQPFRPAREAFEDAFDEYSSRCLPDNAPRVG